MAANLTDKRKLFVEYYLEYMNATKAAKKAGYSEKTAYSMGSQLLKNIEIRQAIDTALAERVMSANEVLSRLADQGRGDMADFAHVTYVSDIQEHPQARLIKKFKRTVRTDKDDVRTEYTEVELYDAQAALVHLGRHLALFTDKTDVTSGGEPLKPTVFLPQVIDDNE